MSVEQAILESIKQLPLSEREEVLRFAKSLNAEVAGRARELRWLEPRESNFFVSTSLHELAESQMVGPVIYPQDLSGGFPMDENIDEFLQEIYEARR